MINTPRAGRINLGPANKAWHTARVDRADGRVKARVVGEGAAPLSAEKNIGAQMLARMGWTEGTGLGAARDGIKEPVRAVFRPHRAGLGIGPK